MDFHSDNDLPWTLDGEFGGNCRNVTVKNNCKAIEIFAAHKGELMTAPANETEDEFQ